MCRYHQHKLALSGQHYAKQRYRMKASVGACAGAVTLAVAFFTAAFLAGALFFEAFAADALTVFLGAAFFLAGPVYFFADADFAFAALAALAFLRLAASFAFAAAESFRFGFGACAGACAAGSDSPLIVAHLCFWAKAIFRRTARLLFHRCGFAGSGVVAVSEGPPDSMARSSAI